MPATIPLTGPNGGAWVKIDTLTVSTRTNQTVATGVQSNVVLDAGTTYLAVASGTARIANDATGFADAKFIRYNKSTGPQDGSSPGYAWNNHGVRLDGVVGGTTTGNFWGTYQSDHVYTQLVEGQGTLLRGWYSDIPGYYGDNSGTLTVDMYAEVPLVTVERVLDASEDGATGLVRFSRTGDTSRPLIVNYTVAGTATSGVDYAPLGTSVTFPADSDVVEVPVQPVADDVAEGVETVLVTLTPSLDYRNDSPDDAEILIADSKTGGMISGTVWEDLNSDGIRQSDESHLAQVTVNLLDFDDNILFRTATGSQGEYSFHGLLEGAYRVQFVAPLLMAFTALDSGTDEDLDGDARKMSGLTGLITLTTPVSSYTGASAGVEPVKPPVIPDHQRDEAHVYYLSSTGQLISAATGLKVAKWSNAFEQGPAQLGKPRGTRLIGPDVNGLDFIDRDPDSFRVVVYDYNKWIRDVPIISATLTTEHALVREKYNDVGSTVPLIRTPFDGTKIPWWSGWYISDTQMLVSNRADDEFSNKSVGIDEVNAIGGPVVGVISGGNTKQVNGERFFFPWSDRTHKVALGGYITTWYRPLPDPDPAGNKNPTPVGLARTVNVQKVVTVTPHFLVDANGSPFGGEVFTNNSGDTQFDPKNDSYWDIDGNGSYTYRLTPAQMMKRFERDLEVANECFAQLGIRFVAGSGGVLTSPQRVINGGIIGATGNALGGANLSESEMALLNGGFNTPSMSDVEVYYVHSITPTPRVGQKPDLRGYAYGRVGHRDASIPDLNSSIILSNAADYYVLAHELIHILTQTDHNARDPAWNLFAAGPTQLFVDDVNLTGQLGSRGFVAQVTDSRRMTQVQLNKMYLIATEKDSMGRRVLPFLQDPQP